MLAGIGRRSSASSAASAWRSLRLPLIRHFKPRWVTRDRQHSAIIAALASPSASALLFGYFPARRAARLDAITAIRGS